MTQLKTPEQFQVGDVIKNTTGTPYSGSVITATTGMGSNQTQISFQNGEVVEFFNGVQHEMQE